MSSPGPKTKVAKVWPDRMTAYEPYIACPRRIDLKEGDETVRYLSYLQYRNRKCESTQDSHDTHTFAKYANGEPENSYIYPDGRTTCCKVNRYKEPYKASGWGYRHMVTSTADMTDHLYERGKIALEKPEVMAYMTKHFPTLKPPTSSTIGPDSWFVYAIDGENEKDGKLTHVASTLAVTVDAYLSNGGESETNIFDF